jgi:hypothetical protein
MVDPHQRVMLALGIGDRDLREWSFAIGHRDGLDRRSQRRVIDGHQRKPMIRLDMDFTAAG